MLVLVDTGALEDSTKDETSEDEVLETMLNDEVLAAVGTIVDVLVTAATVELELLTAALELVDDEEGTTDELAACVVETTAVVPPALVTTLDEDVSTTTADDEVCCCPPISIDADESWSVSLYAAPARGTSFTKSFEVDRSWVRCRWARPRA